MKSQVVQPSGQITSETAKPRELTLRDKPPFQDLDYFLYHSTVGCDTGIF